MIRLVWFALAAVAAATPSAAQTQSPELLSGPEKIVADIQACIGRIGDPGEHPELCMGLHVNPCVAENAEPTPAQETLCIEQETVAWERIVTAEYAQLLARLDEEEWNALRDAQRKWGTFVDADCAFPLVFEESALGPPWAADCRLQHTARRATELFGYLNYLEYSQ